LSSNIDSKENIEMGGLAGEFGLVSERGGGLSIVRRNGLSIILSRKKKIKGWKKRWKKNR